MVAIVKLLNEVCEKTNIRVRLLDSSNNEIFDNLPTTE